ncbi:MAG: hypothetical protein ACLQVD_02400 [Capsulimonadaceae bacterium]
MNSARVSAACTAVLLSSLIAPFGWGQSPARADATAVSPAVAIVQVTAPAVTATNPPLATTPAAASDTAPVRSVATVTAVAAVTVSTSVPAAQPAVSAASAAAAPVDLGSFTGILIDVTGFPDIQRSPSPAVYATGMFLLYPDRTHVPTPDQIQDESIVRYYRTLDAAQAGVGGTHPLVLHAVDVVGPARDGVLLSSTDALLFEALNVSLKFSQTWSVGFLVPADR